MLLSHWQSGLLSQRSSGGTQKSSMHSCGKQSSWHSLHSLNAQMSSPQSGMTPNWVSSVGSAIIIAMMTEAAAIFHFITPMTLAIAAQRRIITMHHAPIIKELRPDCAIVTIIVTLKRSSTPAITPRAASLPSRCINSSSTLMFLNVTF
jgi:hypothetical protein